VVVVVVVVAVVVVVVAVVELATIAVKKSIFKQRQDKTSQAKSTRAPKRADKISGPIKYEEKCSTTLGECAPHARKRVQNSE